LSSSDLKCRTRLKSPRKTTKDFARIKTALNQIHVHPGPSKYEAWVPTTKP